MKRWLARVAAIGRPAADPRRGVAILSFHQTRSDRDHPWWLDFRGHLSLIEDLGYEIVSLDKAVRMVEGETTGERPALAFTFDDGWANNVEVAFPELARRGWAATVFIATSLVGKRPFLTHDEIAGLEDFGVEIGNHTHTHPDLTTLDPKGITSEIRECGDRLEDLTGRRPRFFCYPFGRYNRHVRDAVATTGIRAATTSRVGFNPPGRDPFLLRRLSPDVGDEARHLKVRLRGGYDFLDWRQRSMDRE